MKILMVNKFLYPNGGSETYMFKLGAYLKSIGHEVEYFGMEHEGRCVSNSLDLYTEAMDFHNSSALKKLKLSFKTVYSREARNKMKKLLDKFEPDVVHLNNFNFQLTPSIIYAVKGKNIALVETVHDCQIACPNHRMYIEQKNENCDACLGGNYFNCVKNKCIHNSAIQSLLASAESYIYHKKSTYNLVDKYICPSNYMKETIKKGGIEESKLTVLHNFLEKDNKNYTKKDNEKYVLYFGRLSIEKGIKTLVDVIKELPHIKFIFVGDGPLEDYCKSIDNLELAGRKSGDELKRYIANASFSICPSEWYENCPMTIIESLSLATPVIGSNLGGIPELINDNYTGLIFKHDDKEDLKQKISYLWNNDDIISKMSKNAINSSNNTIENYTEKLLKIYEECIKHNG